MAGVGRPANLLEGFPSASPVCVLQILPFHPQDRFFKGSSPKLSPLQGKRKYQFSNVFFIGIALFVLRKVQIYFIYFIISVVSFKPFFLAQHFLVYCMLRRLFFSVFFALTVNFFFFIYFLVCLCILTRVAESEIQQIPESESAGIGGFWVVGVRVGVGRPANSGVGRF